MDMKFIVRNRNIPKMLADVWGYYTRRMRYGICGAMGMLVLVLGALGRVPRVLETIAVLEALCLPVAWAVPRVVVAMALRNVKKENNGVVPESVTTVEEDGIRVKDSKAEIRVSYDDIIEVKRLRHGYLLASEGASVMLDRTGFIKGTPAEFAAFLQEKRPDLKIS